MIDSKTFEGMTDEALLSTFDDMPECGTKDLFRQEVLELVRLGRKFRAAQKAARLEKPTKQEIDALKDENPPAPPAETGKKKRQMSAAGRAAIKRAQKARWANWRKNR